MRLALTTRKVSILLSITRSVGADLPDEHIRLYQRVTKILSRLTTDIEEHMQMRMNNIDQAIERTNSNLEDLSFGVVAAAAGLKDLERMITGDISKAAEVGRLIGTNVVAMLTTSCGNHRISFLEQQQMPRLCTNSL